MLALFEVFQADQTIPAFKEVPFITKSASCPESFVISYNEYYCILATERYHAFRSVRVRASVRDNVAEIVVR